MTTTFVLVFIKWRKCHAWSENFRFNFSITTTIFFLPVSCSLSSLSTLTAWAIIIFRHVYNMERKSFSHRVLFHVYLPIAQFREIARFWFWNFLQSKSSKFAVKYGWNSGTSWKLTKKFFFWKKVSFFEKIHNFSQIRKEWQTFSWIKLLYMRTKW